MTKYIIYIALLLVLFGCSTAQKNVNKTHAENITSDQSSQKNIAANRYQFAHKMLPRMFFLKPKEILNAVNQQGSVVFETILNEMGGKETYNPSDIKTTHISENSDSFLLIKLPHPNTPPEAYYVAMTIINEQPRYFALEKLTPDFNNKPDEAVFCEWDKSGKHLNYGVINNGIPTKNDFMFFIRGAISGQLQPVIRD